LDKERKGGKRFMSQDDVLKIASNYVRNLKKNGVSVSKAYLFGSYAKNKASEHSDIDVCIVSPNLGKDLIDEMMELGKYTLSIYARIEPHPMSVADFDEKYNLLAHEIKTHGILIPVL